MAEIKAKEVGWGEIMGILSVPYQKLRRLTRLAIILKSWL